jgi:uncharacterized protein YbbC (DUF1343 family)
MVQTGLERLLARIDHVRNRRIGIIANHTSVSSDLRYSWDLLQAKGITVKKIFSPEHGIFGTEQDQVPVSSKIDFPFEIISLYGETFDSLTPMDEHCAGLDCVLFDIQDIGVRYYTYVNTMAYFLKAVHGRDLEFIVLDRPNPLGGVQVEGPILKKGFESFVGALPVPVRHGLTAGELARLAVDYFGIDVNLNVMEMTGWRRGMSYHETGLPWVPPSPNMPSAATALVYPGMCLFEGTSISEGRGTTTPFEVIGAPGLVPYQAADALNDLCLPGVRFRPLYFRPTFNKYRGETIGGVCVHITDAGTYRSFYTGVAMVRTLRDMAPGFRFLTDVYEFNSVHPAFDLLTGSSVIREMIIAGDHPAKIEELWHKEEKVFPGVTEEYHIYRDR